MGDQTNNERREYMCGLIELMSERCAMGGLVYCDEMSMLVLAWLAAGSRFDPAVDSSLSAMILPEVPPVPPGIKRTPRKAGVECGLDSPKRAKDPAGFPRKIPSSRPPAKTPSEVEILKLTTGEQITVPPGLIALSTLKTRVATINSEANKRGHPHRYRCEEINDGSLVVMVKEPKAKKWAV